MGAEQVSSCTLLNTADFQQAMYISHLPKCSLVGLLALSKAAAVDAIAAQTWQRGEQLQCVVGTMRPRDITISRTLLT